MDDHRLPKRVMSGGELENAGKRGLGGEEKEWTDCVAGDHQVFGITGDWSTATLDPGVWQSTVCGEGCRLIVYSRMGEGEGKGVRKPTEEERSGKGGQG